jgi:peptidoglycan/LPS O-acetylase OafA/YrhL
MTDEDGNPKGREVLSLDGLRALAILAVMLFHSGAPGVRAGWIGVDLFFVLSGFLITTLLLGERQRFGRIKLRFFWARRFLRLMPIYFLYVAGITIAIIATPAVSLTVHHGWTPKMLVFSMWTYWFNYLPLGGIWTGQYLTGHLWSLSVEEQYYFIWPVLLYLLPRRWIGLFACTLVCVVALGNYFGYHGHPPHLLLHTRGIGLFIGSAIAIGLHQDSASLKRMQVLSRSATIVAAGAVVLTFAGVTYCTVVLDMTESELLRVGVPAFDLAAAFLIANLWHVPDTHLGRLLSVWPLPQIGAISYGAYLYHMLAWALTWNILLAGAVDQWPSFPKFGMRLIVFFTLTLLMAALSYRFFERPFLQLKGRFRPSSSSTLSTYPEAVAV